MIPEFGFLGGGCYILTYVTRCYVTWRCMSRHGEAAAERTPTWPTFTTQPCQVAIIRASIAHRPRNETTRFNYTQTHEDDSEVQTHYDSSEVQAAIFKKDYLSLKL